MERRVLLALRSLFEEDATLPFGDIEIDYGRAFDRVVYGELFEKTLGFPMTDFDRVRAKASGLKVKNADTLDAVIAGVNIVEADPLDHSVGLGGLPNENGVVELDSSVMHGRSLGTLATFWFP